jgi:hypothetical protein
MNKESSCQTKTENELLLIKIWTIQELKIWRPEAAGFSDFLFRQKEQDKIEHD